MSVPDLFDRKLVTMRRDRAACGEDVGQDFVLVRVMEDLAERLAFINRTFADVAIVGAHHGVPGRILRQALPSARVVELDASQAMLGRCDGPTVLADEESLPLAEQSVDCIIAPLTLQFVNDLPGALWQIQHALKPDGLFLGAMTGGATLQELRQAMLEAEGALRDGVSPRVAPVVDVREVGGLLQRAGFALPVTDSDAFVVTYDTPLDLMRELKAMGASNALAARSRTPMTRGLLMAAAQAYAHIAPSEATGRIQATFEVITLTGWAPHPDQPRPLKPGSATHRLADALGTQERATGDKPGG